MRWGSPLPPSQATPRALFLLKAAEGSQGRARFSEVKEEKAEERRNRAALTLSPFPLKSCLSLSVPPAESLL